MPLDQEAINQQLALLETHRRTLAVALQQQADLGPHAPPGVVNGIAETRAAISRIKATLATHGAPVADHPDDDLAAPSVTTSQPGAPAGAGPRVQSSVAVQENQGTVVGTQLNQPGWAVTGAVYNVAGNLKVGDTASHSSALHQLRAPVGDFVGREREIDQLIIALRKSGGAAISGLRGMGGIGKTELAYVVANQLKPLFPDAQLVVNLRGASTNPLSPEQALQTIIRAFLAEAKLPDELHELKGVYTSVLADKRALILADDARDAAQVRPLLPPAGCALLVTSRQRFPLPGMRADDSIDLGVLPAQAAQELLLEICPRIGRHAATLATLCGGLPLALRVSAGVLATNDTRSVPRYLKQLETERLKNLYDDDDPASSVEASLQLSYDALAPVAQSVLCQLSVFPASFDHPAATAVAAVDGDVTDALEVLRRRSLLEWDAKLERYSLHELVRVFGAARLTDTDAVWLRHAQYYEAVLRMTNQAYKQGGASLLRGLMLFDIERINIEAGQNWSAARAEDDDLAAQLCIAYPGAGWFVLSLRHNPLTTIRWSTPALEASRRLKDRAMEGAHLGNLGLAYAGLGEIRRAIECYELQLMIMREIGNKWGEEAALGNLGNAYSDLGETQQAIDYNEQTLVIAREIGDRRGEGNALGNLGNAYSDLGETQQAIDYHEQALVIDREIGNRRGEGQDLGNLGLAYDSLGETQQAIDYYEQRLVIAREIGDRQGESITSWNLGLALEQQGDLARAAELMQVRVDFLRDIGHPDAEQRAARLGKLRQRLEASPSAAPDMEH